MKYFFSVRKVPLIFGCHAPMGCEVESRRLRANKSAVATEAVPGNLGNVAAGGAGRRADGPGGCWYSGQRRRLSLSCRVPLSGGARGKKVPIVRSQGARDTGALCRLSRRLRFKEAVTHGEGWEVTSAAPPTTRVVFFPDFPENYEK